MKGKVRDEVIDQVVGDKNVNVESHCHFASNALLHRYSAACTRTSLVPTSSPSNRVLLRGMMLRSVSFSVEDAAPANPWNAFQKDLKNSGKKVDRIEAAAIYKNLMVTPALRSQQQGPD